MKLLATLVFVLLVALAGCKDNDRRRDRPREPRVETPFVGRVINIPACGAGKAGYITTRWQPPISGAMRLEYVFEQSPDAVVVDNEDRTKVRGVMALFFQRDNDDGYEQKYNRGFRQWSMARQILEPGEHVFEVALTPDQWNFGHAEFEEAKADVENVGFTLAGYGGASVGHGVCMKQGTASITITAFTIGG